MNRSLYLVVGFFDEIDAQNEIINELRDRGYAFQRFNIARHMDAKTMACSIDGERELNFCDRVIVTDGVLQGISGFERMIGKKEVLTLDTLKNSFNGGEIINK